MSCSNCARSLNISGGCLSQADILQANEKSKGPLRKNIEKLFKLRERAPNLVDRAIIDRRIQEVIWKRGPTDLYWRKSPDFITRGSNQTLAAFCANSEIIHQPEEHFNQSAKLSCSKPAADFKACADNELQKLAVTNPKTEIYIDA